MSEEENTNPLAKYFRTPGLEISLPTKGRYMPEGSVEFNALGKLAVYPMKASDEMILTNPDALMSGVAVETIIQSCIPAIKDASMVSSPDLDVLIIAIRAASNGTSMDLDVKCPECEHEMALLCDLTGVLSTAKEISEEISLRLNEEMVIYFRPHSIRQQTSMMVNIYNENRRVMMAENDDDIDDEGRRQLLRQTLDTIQEFQANSLTAAIEKIVIPEKHVTDPSHISEFVKNAKKEWLQQIKQKVEEVNSMGIDKSMPVTCEKCDHEWHTALEFNPSTFFGQGSSN